MTSWNSQGFWLVESCHAIFCKSDWTNYRSLVFILLIKGQWHRLLLPNKPKREEYTVWSLFSGLLGGNQTRMLLLRLVIMLNKGKGKGSPWQFCLVVSNSRQWCSSLFPTHRASVCPQTILRGHVTSMTRHGTTFMPQIKEVITCISSQMLSHV